MYYMLYLLPDFQLHSAEVLPQPVFPPYLEGPREVVHLLCEQGHVDQSNVTLKPTQ